MKYTGNYNLKKPEGNDVVNIEDLNDNADIIDQQLKNHANALATKETPAGAQQKADAALATANAYTDQKVSVVSQELESHKNESAIHKTSDVIRTETNTQLKVEVVSSSESESPEQGRIVFDASLGKFLGGNGSEWV